MTNREQIENGTACLGIEFGSTRIKAVLINDKLEPISSGAYEWQNKLCEGYWSYSADEMICGLRGCYADLKKNTESAYHVKLTKLAAIGISGMMHGYMAFDKEDRLLVPFRTWRNTTTESAAAELSEQFGFNIPQRWSISHLYQAIKNGEPHVNYIAYITTLAGYIHYLLTGNHIVGIGEASGMFPVSGVGYHQEMLSKFRSMVSDYDFNWDIGDVLPKIGAAGECAGKLHENGAKLMDVSGELQAGIPVCPPEGDAQTGMVATNSIKPSTGNISAGTSVFSMLVLEKPLKRAYPEIDIVSTPEGNDVAMVHCNNCCSELDAWVSLFGEFAGLCGYKTDKSSLYEMLYKNAVRGDPDCSGINVYNFLSGEPIAGVENGVPMYMRPAESNLNLANFFRAQIYSAFATLNIGNNILFDNEHVMASVFMAHGGIFKVPGVAQQILADCLDTPVAVMQTAGEGGAWGMALLAAYMKHGSGESLHEYLEKFVFDGMEKRVLNPDKNGRDGFARFMEKYVQCLDAVRIAGKGYEYA